MQPEQCQEWICPDLRSHWQLIKTRNANQYMLRSTETTARWLFSEMEGCALRYFTGNFTVAQVHQFCQQQIADLSPNLVLELIKKLIQFNVLSIAEPVEETAPKQGNYQLRDAVQWFRQSDGTWILRNPEDVTRQMQVSDRHKAAIAQLGTLSPAEILQQCDLSAAELRLLLQQLAAAGMLVGIDPPKPPQRKFTPLQLLSFSRQLGNPDRWLSRYVHHLAWIWTTPVAGLLAVFLLVSLSYGLQQRSPFAQMAIQLWTNQDGWQLLLFGALSMLVISLHELGHAFTLKHYGGTVPEFGAMFICLFPAAYVNTTDQYMLNRRQRSLVVGAGVLCQFTLAAIGFWGWVITAESTWLHLVSYLLVIASLFTVAINLNPLTKFDGYYLALAMTGVNNLRSRSFSFYANLFSRRPLREAPTTWWILATYAPGSLVYTLLVFGFLLMNIAGWTMTHIPAIALILLGLWAIYYFFPTPPSKA